MTDEEKNEISEKQIVVFNLGNEEFGVDINDVKEIIRFQKITPIPNTAEYILGVLNLRGGIVVIIDLNQKLGYEPKEFNENTRIIIIEIEDSIIGMVVENATEVTKLSLNQIEPAPTIITEKINADYIQGVAVINDRLLILLDFKKVLKSKDINNIENISHENFNDEEHIDEKDINEENLNGEKLNEDSNK